MEQTLREHLRQTAAVFETFTGVTPKTVGKRAINDNTYFDRVVDGGQGFTIGTYDRVMRWLSENWPAGADWPVGVPRPANVAAVPSAA